MFIEHYLIKGKLYYAHKKIGCHGQSALIQENLSDHSALTKAYFLQIMDALGLRAIFNKIFSELFINKIIENIHTEIFMDLLLAVAELHDVGKTNPQFQIKKMSNTTWCDQVIPGIMTASHSHLSAIVYLDAAFSHLQQIQDKQQLCALRAIAIINAYVISRHHSDLSELLPFISMLEESDSQTQLVTCLCESGSDAFINKLMYFGEARPINKVGAFWLQFQKNFTQNPASCLFIYTRLLFSILVAADYYATTDFMDDCRVQHFYPLGIAELKKAYEDSPLLLSIREQQRKAKVSSKSKTDINDLRTEIFLEAESTLLSHNDQSVFYLEAPTGSGKSNCALNLAFHSLSNERHKLIFVYPFNTLIDQNYTTLKNIFREVELFEEKCAVINSVTPIKIREKASCYENDEIEYKEAFLDRQFLHYPCILTTHVSLFNLLFSQKQSDILGFYQLANSVIILDEIHSYNNTIWAEIIGFIEAYASILNIRFIIMSATLPDFSFLSEFYHPSVKLLPNAEKYYQNPLFKNRVELSFELLHEQGSSSLPTKNIEKTSATLATDSFDCRYAFLRDHIKERLRPQIRILVEFLFKKSAYEFFERMTKEDLAISVQLLTGDDNVFERERILAPLREDRSRGMLLITTQVIENGVDIDMDLGYKNISILDSEEQFLGRINRSCRYHGMVYFFCIDQAKSIYRNDFRLSPSLQLSNPDMQKILVNKDFTTYYSKVLYLLKQNWNDSCNENGLHYFWEMKVRNLDFPFVAQRMSLIKDNERVIPLFLSRELTLDDGSILDGDYIWRQYKELLQDNLMSYAKKMILLSKVRSQMKGFIYEFERYPYVYSDSVGELYKIDHAERYFENGKLLRNRFAEINSMVFL